MLSSGVTAARWHLHFFYVHPRPSSSALRLRESARVSALRNAKPALRPGVEAAIQSIKEAARVAEAELRHPTGTHGQHNRCHRSCRRRCRRPGPRPCQLYGAM